MGMHIESYNPGKHMIELVPKYFVIDSDNMVIKIKEYNGEIMDNRCFVIRRNEGFIYVDFLYNMIDDERNLVLIEGGIGGSYVNGTKVGSWSMVINNERCKKEGIEINL